MAFSSIGNLDLGQFLQIVFTRGAMVQVSKSQREWEMISRMRDGNPNGRERRFLFINSLGYAAAQTANPGITSAFPSAQKASIQEYTALYKEFDVTVELEYNLWKAASLSPDIYAEPLAKEIELKSIVARRIMGIHLFGDGTGVFGTASATISSDSATEVSVTLKTGYNDRGHVRWFQQGDLFLAKNPDGTAANPTVASGTFAAYRVKRIDPKNDKVIFEPIDANGNVLSIVDAGGGVYDSNIDENDVFYRHQQKVIPNLSGSISDYGSVTDVIPGLGSLVANDGRVVHGINMDSSAGGTVLDLGGSTALSIDALQEGLDEVDMRVGKGEFSYKQAVMSPEARRALIASREEDRRFNTVDDTLRGGKNFGYVHDEDTVLFVPSEFCPKQALYVLPEGKQDGNKVISYFGTDFEPVQEPMGSKMFLKPSSNGGHEKNIVMYMGTRGTLVCHRPASVLKIQNWS